MSSREDKVLEVSHLSVRAGGGLLLEDLSFSVRIGEVLTILGPNGAGKTVLLRTLLGILPHEGSIAWAPDTRIGYVPQRLPYVRDVPLSIEDFFALKGCSGTDARELLGAVGLADELAAKPMGALSSGQFQRVLIAWALFGEPHVLLFDEPTAGVDIRGEETVYSLLARLHRERGLTIVIVSHDLAVVYKLSSTVLCLNRRLLCHGAAVEVLTPERLRQMYGMEVKYYRHEHG